jgi:ABC-type antimicrobial peptide transport system permease subunit
MQLQTISSNILLIILIIAVIVIVILLKDQDLVRMAIRNLGRRKTRNFLTVVGIGLSISLYVAFDAAATNASQTFLDIIQLTGGNIDFEISRIDGEAFDEDILDKVLQVEGVKSAAPRLQRFCIISISDDGNSTAAQVIGIDPEYDKEFGDLFDYNSSEPINDLVIGQNVIVSELVLDGITYEEEDDDGEISLVNATVGDRLKIKYRSGRSSRSRVFDIAAFAEATGKVRDESFGLSVWVTIDAARKLFPKTGGKIDRLIIELDPAFSDQFEEVQKGIEDVVEAEDDQLEVFSPKQTQLENAQGALIGLNAGTSFAGVTVLLAMVFLIFNAINITLAERKYEIGVLRSIGFKKLKLFRLFIYEILAIGIAGSLLGLLLGIGLSQALFQFLTNTVISDELADPTVIGEAGQFFIDPISLRDGFIIGIILTIIAGLYPLITITRIAIINALRPESRTTTEPTLRSRLKCIIGGIILLVVGIILFVTVMLIPEIEMTGMLSGFISAIALALIVVGVPQIVCGLKEKYRLLSAGVSLLFAGIVEVQFLRATGLVGNFILVAGSILFTAGILRGVGSLFNFFFRRIPGLEYVSELASRNLWRKPARSTLTFGIFTIALSLVITVATITGSVTAGILNFVDDNLEADMFIISQVGAPPNLSGNITQNIQGINWENTSEGWVPAITVQQQAGAQFDLWDEDFDSLLIGVNSTNYAIINENTRIIAPNDTDAFKLFKQLKNPNENACIISEKLANELQVRIDQKTPIEINAAGNKTEFRVRGIISNNFIGAPQAGFFCIIDIDRFYEFGFEESANIFTLKLDQRYENGTEVNPQVVADQIDAIWGDEYKLSFSLKQDIKADIEEGTAQISVFFNIISYASIIVGLLALLTTLIKIVSERRREIGLLRTIGVKRAKVIQLILAESIFLALIGLILGLLDGYFLGATIVRLIAASGGSTFSAVFIVPWNEIILTTVIAIVVAIGAAIVPAWQAGKVAPAESLRYTG